MGKQHNYRNIEEKQQSKGKIEGTDSTFPSLKKIPMI